MGADGFVVFYGVRRLTSDEVEAKSLETGKHQYYDLARKVGLEVWWGLSCADSESMEEEGAYILLGAKIGNFGLEGKLSDAIFDPQLTQISADVKRKLLEGGITTEPSLLFQVDPDF